MIRGQVERPTAIAESAVGDGGACAYATEATTVAGERDGLIPLMVAMGAVWLGSWQLRHHALVSRHSLEEIGNAIEGSARRVNLRSRSVAGGYELSLPEGGLTLMLRPLPGRLTLITMRPAPSHRKAELFAQLFAKQYRRVLPTIVIRAS